jgi:quinol monooxygenase YgiN
MTFVQIIEFETSHADEMDQLLEEWIAATGGKRTAVHGMLTKDRDNPSHLVNIVEFPSYAEAMRNSELPETQKFSGRMQQLCSGPPRFMNLEVMRDERL